MGQRVRKRLFEECRKNRAGTKAGGAGSRGDGVLGGRARRGGVKGKKWSLGRARNRGRRSNAGWAVGVVSEGGEGEIRIHRVTKCCVVKLKKGQKASAGSKKKMLRTRNRRKGNGLG